MNDSYPTKARQSYMVTDLTFTQPMFIRPGDLRPAKARRTIRPNSLQAPKRSLDIDPGRLKRVAVIRPDSIKRPSPARPFQALPLVAPAAAAVDQQARRRSMHLPIVDRLAAYLSVFGAGNWRSLVADKHKRYTIDKGLTVRPETFRTQTASLVVASVLLLGTAQTVAPSSPEQTQPRDNPLTVTYPARLSGEVTKTTDDTPDVVVTDGGSASGSAASQRTGGQTGNASARTAPAIIPVKSSDSSVVPSLPTTSGTPPPDNGTPSQTPVVLPVEGGTQPTVPLVPVAESEPPAGGSTPQVVLDGASGMLDGVLPSVDRLLP